MANLRVLYNNLMDTATVSTNVTPSTGTSEQYLKNDYKHQIFKTSATSVTINITIPSSTVNCVILPQCNLTSNATATLSVNGVSKVSGAYYISPGSAPSVDVPTGASKYSYGGGNTARIYFPTTTGATSLSITINDAYGSGIELTRMLVGNYWSPTYNTSFGASIGIDSQTKQERADSGLLISNRGTQAKKMNFSLDWLTGADLQEFIKILNTNSLHKPLFISLFPEDSSNIKESTYQIYGKLTELASIAVNNPYMYSSGIVISEI